MKNVTCMPGARRLYLGCMASGIVLVTAACHKNFRKESNDLVRPELLQTSGFTLNALSTLNPFADAHVWGGAQANNNYGTGTQLLARYHSDPAYHRQAYLKFDLTGYSDSVAAAYLNIYVNTADSGSSLKLYPVATDSWAETGITWTNKPAAGTTPVVTATGIKAGWNKIDITSYVAQEVTGDKTLSVQVTSADNKYIYFQSREGVNKPYLQVINDEEASPVLSAKGLSFVWQDRFNQKNPDSSYTYTDPNDLFQPNRGRRSGAVQSERRSFVFDTGLNRRVEKVVQLTNGLRNECYATGWWPGNYKEFGLAVDIFVPTNLNLEATNAPNGVTDGKTSFGLQLGVYDLDNPGTGGFSSSLPVSQVVYPYNQKGAVAFMNWAWRKSTGNLEFRWYHYAVRKSGVLRTSTANGGEYGYAEPSFVLPKGRWFTLTNYMRVDSDGLNGVLESWITDQGVSTRVSQITGLDLGGAVIDRGMTTGTGTLVGTNGGWRIHTTYAAEMVGGTIYNFINGADPFYKASNFRVYGKE